MVGKQPSKKLPPSRSGRPRGAKGSDDAESSGYSEATSKLPTKRSRSNEVSDATGRPSKSARPGSYQSTRQSTAATTFGIEFELILAFHETALNIMKDDGSILDIIKDHGHSNQYDLLSHEFKVGNRAFAGRTLWPSWLVKVPASDETILKDAVRGTSQRTFDGTQIRRYIMEPLLLVRRALVAAGLTKVQVIGWSDTGQTREHCPICKAKKGKYVTLDHYTTKFHNYRNDVLLRSMKPSYDIWTLTNDYTIVPVRRSELKNLLVERGVGSEIKSWDSYGFEMITRIMRFDQLEDSFDEIGNFLSALKAQQHVDTLTSVWATAHVHIGFDAGAKAELSHRFFQHVAFILISYERLITFCFPRRCSGAVVSSPVIPQPSIEEAGGITEGPADQSRFEPLEPLSKEQGATQDAIDKAAEVDANDEFVRKMEEDYTGDDDVRSNHDYLRECLAKSLKKASNEITWHDMRDAIFTEEDNLVQLMCWMQKPNKDDKPDDQRHRGYMVNWCNIYQIWTSFASFKPFKPTLEFRQHPCTTDVDEIKHWVLLLQAVMAVARARVLADTKYGSSESLDQNRTFAEREGSKYPNDGLPFGTVKAYVTQLLGLGEVEGLYWENRYERFKNDRPM